jgi:proline iminopeptidase
VTVPGGELVGFVEGGGPPVLLLHGGPSLSFNCLDGLVDELVPGYQVAGYQQRSLLPSTLEGPFTVERHVADAASVLDALDWPRAIVVGHSWGGYLMLALAATHEDRLIAGMGIDSIGVLGDGGTAEFERAMSDRTPRDARRRAEELDRRAMAGQGTEAEAMEGMRLVWPAYFADPEQAPPMPDVRLSVEGYSETLESMFGGMEALAAILPGVQRPILLMYGDRSPIPASASTDLAAHMPQTEAVAIADAGHFLWLEQRGAVRQALDRLVRSLPAVD